jgi:hypothetical protein
MLWLVRWVSLSTIISMITSCSSNDPKLKVISSISRVASVASFLWPVSCCFACGMARAVGVPKHVRLPFLERPQIEMLFVRFRMWHLRRRFYGQFRVVLHMVWLVQWVSLSMFASCFSNDPKSKCYLFDFACGISGIVPMAS